MFSIAEQDASISVPLTGLMTDNELAEILRVTADWVRSHASEIPGICRLGMYYRFHRGPLSDWLGGLGALVSADEVASLLKVPASWVYANADQIPGVLRLGRYVRFRPSVFHDFLNESGACE